MRPWGISGWFVCLLAAAPSASASPEPPPAPAPASGLAAAPDVPTPAPAPRATGDADPGDPPPRPAPPPPATELHSYRWKIIAADVATLGFGIAATQLSRRGERPGMISTAAITSYFFAAPLIHAIDHEPGRGLKSFGLRIAAPLLFGLIGRAFAPEPCASCEHDVREDRFFQGANMGVATAFVLDGLFLARPVARPVRRAWTPLVTASPHGVALGVVGEL
ncbi:MAG: hypothetical protein ACTHU0_12610 [Kofleriaceae bacterium]